MYSKYIHFLYSKVSSDGSRAKMITIATLRLAQAKKLHAAYIYYNGS